MPHERLSTVFLDLRGKMSRQAKDITETLYEAVYK